MKIFHAHIPRINGAIDEGRIGAVAERIRVDYRRLMDELALSLKKLDNILIAIFAEAALKFSNRICKRARLIERIGKSRNSSLLADAEVILTVRGSNMN